MNIADRKWQMIHKIEIYDVRIIISVKRKEILSWPLMRDENKAI
jgi:hypothetical protein